MSYAECRNGKCCNAKCRYVECRGTMLEGSIKVITRYVYWVSARKKARLHLSKKHVKSAQTGTDNSGAPDWSLGLTLE